MWKVIAKREMEARRQQIVMFYGAYTFDDNVTIIRFHLRYWQKTCASRENIFHFITIIKGFKSISKSQVKLASRVKNANRQKEKLEKKKANESSRAIVQHQRLICQFVYKTFRLVKSKYLSFQAVRALVRKSISIVVKLLRHPLVYYSTIT